MPTKATKTTKKAAKKAGRYTAPKPPPEQLTHDDVTDIAEFKKDLLGVATRFPSGRVMVVRNPGIQAFLTAGIIPNSLLPFVEEGMKRGEKAAEKSTKNLEKEALTNPELLADVMKLADGVALYCITKPQVHEIPHNEDGSIVPYAERDQTKLYVDEIPLEDKMFIFQYAVGGTRDLEQFRKELG